MILKRFFSLQVDHERLRALFIVGGLVFLIILTSSPFEGDLVIFHQATKLLREGFNPYALPGHVENPIGGFTYPPMVLLITFLPTLLPLGFALYAWTVVCVLMWCASVYLWTHMIWDESPDHARYVRTITISLLAPCLWSFWFHQLTVPIFFFGTLAAWLTYRSRSPFGCGVFAGLILAKPHLMLPFLALLVVHSPNIKKFLAGGLMLTLLSFSPWLVGIRPLQDLIDFSKRIETHATYLFSRDDQSLSGKLGRAVLHKSLAPTLAALSDRDNLWREDAAVKHHNRIKQGAFVLVFLGWASFLWFGRPVPFVTAAVISFALGIAFAPYSHLYDGVLLIPAALWVAKSTESTIGLDLLMILFFVGNAFLAYFLLFNSELDRVMWTRAGWSSTIYLVGYLALAATSWRKSRLVTLP